MTKPTPITSLIDIVNRAQPPAPWSEGDNIPWDDPDFSRRMLAEHLSQDHDLASRRRVKIDAQVEWIFETLLGGEPTPILDLACGPGLYTERLAERGARCTGIDFAPAAIEHATAVAAAGGLPCTYERGDLRTADFGAGFGLVMMLWGQLNVFRRDEARAIVARAHRALRPGGLLLLEPQTAQQVEGGGEPTSSWSTATRGLFSDRPHLLLQEGSWDAEARARTERFFVVDAESGAITRHALTTEAYGEAELEGMLTAAGFAEVSLLPSLIGEVDPDNTFNLVVVGRR